MKKPAGKAKPAVLKKIEKRFGIQLPNAYLTLFDLGCMSYPGATYAQADDAEWIDPAELAEFKWPDFYDLKAPYVPFATMGTGDYFCWDFSKMTAFGEPAIALCGHADMDANWHAPCLAGLFYRNGLQYLASDDESDRKTQKAMKPALAALRSLNADAWANDLDAAMLRPPFTRKLGSKGKLLVTGRLTDSDVIYRVAYYFGKEYADDTAFQWQNA